MAYRIGKGYFFDPTEGDRLRAAVEGLINDGKGHGCAGQHWALVAVLKACQPGFSEGELRHACRMFLEGASKDE